MTEQQGMDTTRSTTEVVVEEKQICEVPEFPFRIFEHQSHDCRKVRRGIDSEILPLCRSYSHGSAGQSGTLSIWAKWLHRFPNNIYE